MKIFAVVLTFLFLVHCSVVPEQIHIALTDKDDEMSVTWLTPSDVSKPLVQYGFTSSNLNYSQVPYENTYYEWVDFYVSGQIHFARLTGLQSKTTFYYRVGDVATNTWSDVISFQTRAQEYPVTFIATGDLGTAPWCIECKQTFQGMIDESNNQRVDFVMHSGDLSYANGEQPIWDKWQRDLQPLASRIPYMVTVGNHESASLWLAFLKRFDMPAVESGGNEGNLFYSFNYGPIHFIALSSEAVLFWHSLAQYNWLANDLATVDRKKTPWVFAAWHRPWYCSNTKHEDSAESMRQSYEDLLHKFNVDISFTGHVHAYERTLPIYNHKIMSSGMVTIVNGNGGNNEGLAKGWVNPQPKWSAYRESNFGFGVARVINATHLHWQMKRSVNMTIADDYWFIKNTKY